MCACAHTHTQHRQAHIHSLFLLNWGAYFVYILHNIMYIVVVTYNKEAKKKKIKKKVGHMFPPSCSRVDPPDPNPLDRL